MRQEVDEIAKSAIAAFPRVGRCQAVVDREKKDAHPTRELWIFRVKAPWPVSVAAAIQDVDYCAPVWVNVLAIGTWLWGP